MAALTASSFGSLGDHTPFQLPMSGLFADVEVGAGSVAFTDEFLDADPSLRVAVLHHWMKGLQREKNGAFVQMFREFAAPLRGLSIVEQIERFRQMCVREAIDCPAELPLLLQRF